jgi:xanthosine utilization system XapX-like protein
MEIMENKPFEFENTFVVVVLIIAAIAFLAGTIYGVIYSFKKTEQPFNPTLSGWIVGLAGIMTTNLGVVLGIEIDQGTILARIGESAISNLHLWTAVGYFIVLFLVGVAWIVWLITREPDNQQPEPGNNESKRHLAPFIPLFGETFLGVLTGVVGAAFAIPPSG